MKHTLASTVFLSLLLASPAMGRGNPFGDRGWCAYPAAKGKGRAPANPRALQAAGEGEPNDVPGQAQGLPFGDGAGEDRDFDVSGALGSNSDADYYSLSLQAGDVIGVAALGGNAPDTIVAITDVNGVVLVSNDDHGGIADFYPPSSPLPGGVDARDSALSWVAPADGDYLVRVTSWNNGSAGSYTLQIRGPRPGLEAQDAPATQILFVDFDGASGINAPALFGSGNSNATLSPLSSFLGGWGLGPADENAVIDAILATLQENLDDLRQPGLNGDRDADATDGHFDFVIRNSRDHADPFGQPNVSRLIVGGTINELGISTIGIAEHIDPGNFGTTDTAVILLDLLSAPAPDPNSVNTIPRAAGTSIIDAIGIIVGNITTHEAGHYLGNWHTNNQNSTRCIMDRGGNIRDNIAGAGPDGILGTNDDVDVDFVVDQYEPAENVAVGDEPTDRRTAFALATGAAGAGCAVDADCDDGDACNGAETCDLGSGACQAGTPLVCDDGSVCTDDSCDPGTGQCSFDPISCDDGNACTADSCDAQTGCASAPIAGCCGNDLCEAGEDCNSCAVDCLGVAGGSCGDGVCEGGAENCNTCPSDCRCAGGRTCKKACCGDGICSGENVDNCPADCDPGFTPPTGQCCGDGTCEGSEDDLSCGIDCDLSCGADVDCDDGDPCNGDETCDLGSGLCLPGAAIDCDDANACTDDDCDSGSGQCVNQPVSCDDGDACTDDSCDPGAGCQSVPNGNTCCAPKNGACSTNADCCSNSCKPNGRCR